MTRPAALLFDYGNTLIAFGPEQQAAQLAAMERVLKDHGVAYDREALDRLRREQVMRPYGNGGVENVFEEVCREVVELFRPDPDGAVTRMLMRARREAFTASIRVDPAVPALLTRLKTRYRVGLLSNYPCTLSIMESLKVGGLSDFFERVVVSADVGYAKPHPATYAALLEAMDLRPEEAVYVGDNWLADIQGAKRAGMRAVWIREHTPYEVFDPGEGDHPADAEITRLADLEAVLEGWS